MSQLALFDTAAPVVWHESVLARVRANQGLTHIELAEAMGIAPSDMLAVLVELMRADLVQKGRARLVENEHFLTWWPT